MWAWISPSVFRHGEARSLPCATPQLVRICLCTVVHSLLVVKGVPCLTFASPVRHSRPRDGARSLGADRFARRPVHSSSGTITGGDPLPQYRAFHQLQPR